MQAVQGVSSRVLTENQLSTLVVNVILPTGRSGNCSCRRSGQNNIRTGAAYLPFPAAGYGMSPKEPRSTCDISCTLVVSRQCKHHMTASFEEVLDAVA